MSRGKIVGILGALIFIMPYIGLPDSWKTVFYTLAGLVLIIVVFPKGKKTLYRQSDSAVNHRDSESNLASITPVQPLEPLTMNSVSTPITPEHQTQ